ncbi:MAG: efflux RND transporter periplasmic adaptor subunit [Pseudomonadota bacterium]
MKLVHGHDATDGAKSRSEAPEHPLSTSSDLDPAHIDGAHWTRLNDAASPESYAAAWLEIQCGIVGGVEQAVVVLGPADSGPFAPVARWPAGSLPSEDLAGIAELAMRERRGAVQRLRRVPDEDDARAGVAFPIVVDDRLCGVAAFLIAAPSSERLRTVMRQVQWGCAWLESLVRRKAFGRRERLVAALDVTALSLDHPRFQAAATAVATELATELECEWVAFGLLRGKHVRVAALSHSAEFGERSNLLRDIGTAMAEAVDQRAHLVFPAEDGGLPRVTHAHQTLIEQHGAGAICTVPLREGDEIVGALMFKRSAGEAFDESVIEFCRHVATLVGPIMSLKRRDDHWLREKPKQALANGLSRVFGPRHIGFKLSMIALAALVIWLATAEGEYRVTADATLEGTIQRAVTAPIDGYVMSAAVRPGDVVKAGDELSRLDDKDLALQRVKWASRREQHTRQSTRALAERNRAEVRILNAQIAQADAELQLINEQLARTRLRAPFDGVVVSGDLSQSLGVPVERGEVLFQLAPLDSYRVILKVDEREVSVVDIGQRGTLALAGLPGERLSLEIRRITPVSSVEDGQNYFRVEAALEEPTTALRPGMEGIGKVDIAERKLLWIWTHKFVQSVRLAWWWFTG